MGILSKKIGRALSVILILLLVAVLISIVFLHRHANDLKLAALELAESGPDFEQVDESIKALDQAKDAFHQYFAQQQDHYLADFKESLQQFKINTESLLLNMPDTIDPATQQEGSFLIIQGLKSELIENVRNQLQNIDTLIARDYHQPTLEDIFSTHSASSLSSSPLVRSISKDTLFFDSETEYNRFIQAIQGDRELPVSEQGPVEQQEGLVQEPVDENIINQDTDEKYYYHIDRSNPVFGLIESYVNRALFQSHNHHTRNYRELLEQLINRVNDERNLVAENNRVMNEMQTLLLKFKDLKTLESDYKTQAGIAYLTSKSDRITRLNMLGAAFLVLISLIMVWFLKRNWNYEKELNHTKEHAEALADERSSFLASMSHEIRTPLNSIVGFTELLGRTRLDNEQREMVDAAKVSANVLMSMVNDILDMGKLESGNFKPRENLFTPNEVIEDVVATMDLQAKNKGIPIKLKNYIIDDQKLIGDDLILRQVLLNLLSNAIKFTEKGFIQINATIKNQGEKAILKVDVADTGTGISEDKQKQLFKKYYSLNTDKQVGGTGLGLYLCRLMINLLGGEISCTSKPNEGTTFSFTLPYRNVKKIPAITGRSFQDTHAIPKSNSKQHPNGIVQQFTVIKDKKFLVVDDNPLNIKLVNMILQKWGGIVDEANDGISALRNLKEKDYDIILTDLMMPIMDGFELAKQIKNIDGKNRNIPIIALTADLILEEHSVSNKYDEFDTVVIKPINEEELYFKLTALLSA